MKTRPLIVIVVLFAAILAHSVQAADTYKLTLWNQYNGGLNDRGTAACKIEAFKDGVVVWKNDKLRLKWEPSKDTKVSTSFTLPSESPGIDTFKISIIEWVQEGGGLSEVEIYKNGDDITNKCRVSVSAAFDDHFTAANLTDKITSSKTKNTGYWLLPDKTGGFVEIKLP